MNFDSLQAYGIGDMFASIKLLVFLKENVSWYPYFVGKFYANMQCSRRKFEIYCLINGTRVVLNPNLIKQVYYLPNIRVEFFSSSFDELNWDMIAKKTHTCQEV